MLALQPTTRVRSFALLDRFQDNVRIRDAPQRPGALVQTIRNAWQVTSQRSKQGDDVIGVVAPLATNMAEYRPTIKPLDRPE